MDKDTTTSSPFNLHLAYNYAAALERAGMAVMAIERVSLVGDYRVIAVFYDHQGRRFQLTARGEGDTDITLD